MKKCEKIKKIIKIFKIDKEKQDLVFDRHVNNELNALLEAKNALEVKIDDVKLNIIRKKIEKSEYFIKKTKKN